MPSFPGGEEALDTYLIESLIYPDEALVAGIEGVVFVLFIVEKDGRLTNIELLKGIGGGCDEEAIRLVEEMTLWEPGKQRGKAVRTQFNLPVSFQLESTVRTREEEIAIVEQETGDTIHVYDYYELDEQPEFPGGEEALSQYVTDNMEYPELARELGTQGIVYTQFTIEKDGSVSNVKILRGIGTGCDEEVVRVMMLMPKWKPGMQQGKAVAVEYVMPVRFVVGREWGAGCSSEEERKWWQIFKSRY